MILGIFRLICKLMGWNVQGRSLFGFSFFPFLIALNSRNIRMFLVCLRDHLVKGNNVRHTHCKNCVWFECYPQVHGVEELPNEFVKMEREQSKSKKKKKTKLSLFHEQHQFYLQPIKTMHKNWRLPQVQWINEQILDSAANFWFYLVVFAFVCFCTVRLKEKKIRNYLWLQNKKQALK